MMNTQFTTNSKLPFFLTVSLPIFLTACSLSAPDTPVRDELSPVRVRVAEIPRQELTIDQEKLAPVATPPEQLETIGLDALVEEVLLSNPELLADFAAFEAKLERIPQVSSLPDPTLNYAHFVEEVQTRTGEQDFVLGISQKFPWFGKLTLKGRMADAEAQAALMEYRARMLDLIEETATAYHRLAFEYSARDLTREEKIYLNQFLESASASYASGQSGRQAVLKAQAELARVDNELLGFPARIEALEATLNRLRNAEEEAALPRPAEAPVEIARLNETAFMDRARENRPELDRIEQMARMASIEEGLARRDYYPDVTVGANYIGVGDRPDDPATAPDDEGEDAWSLGIGINIPIPNARRRAAIREARRKQEEWDYRREALDDRIGQEIRARTALLESLSGRLTIFEESLTPLAQEAFETSQSEYIAGTGDYLDFLEAERTLLRTRMSWLKLQRDYQVALAELERTLGVRIQVGDE